MNYRGVICIEESSYEVIRFIEKGPVCYASIDRIEGFTLYNWVKDSYNIKKELFYNLIHKILKQLILFYKQAEHTGYGFLDPDHIIIDKKCRPFLLNPEYKLEKKHVLCEKYFVSDSRKRLRSDIYNYGKTIQFILAHMNCEPVLTKWEEIKFQDYIKKCLNTDEEKGYHSFLILKKRLPVLKKKKVRKKPSGKRTRIVLKCLLFAIFLIMLIFSFQDKNNEAGELTAGTEESAMEELYEEDEELFYEKAP